MKKILHNKCQCLKCGEVLESTHCHDSETGICKCDNETFTDGGKEYIRRGGKDIRLIKDLTVYDPEGESEE